MKKYDVLVANGSETFDVSVSGVALTDLKDGVYVMQDSDKRVIFSAPTDSVIYINES